jgi:RNA-directed DNA polymerase
VRRERRPETPHHPARSPLGSPLVPGRATIVCRDMRRAAIISIGIMSVMILAQLASDDVLEAAYEWLCRRRRDYSPNADVWAFRCRWAQEKNRIKNELWSGGYRFSLLTRVTLQNDDEIDLWSSRDALVLKALAIVLAEHLPCSRRCTHLKGNGGGKYAVREVRDHLSDSSFVLRTDVKSYYASIDHFVLLDLLAAHIKDRRVLNLLSQYLRSEAVHSGVTRKASPSAARLAR